MKTFFLVQIVNTIVLLFALNAFAGKHSSITDTLVEFGFIPPQNYQICPEEIKPIGDYSARQIWGMAVKAKQSYDACEPARYLEELLRQHPQSEFTKEAKRELLRTYLRTQDYVMVMNRGNQFLEDFLLYKDLNIENDSEYIHYQIMIAVYGKIRLEENFTDKKMQFVSYSLGASILQSEQNPYLENLRYKTFLERYPKSPFAQEISTLSEVSKQLFGKNLLDEARMSKVKADYPMALRKLDMILRWGPTIQVFEDSLYEMIEVCSLFAMGIEYKKIPDFKLAEMTNQPLTTKFSTADRHQLAQETLDLGNTYLEKMKSGIPNSTWTQKALKEFGTRLEFF